MSSSKNKEMIIVKAISQLSISDDVFERNEFKQVISDVIKSQSKVESDIAAAEKAKKDVDDGWAIVNLIKGRNKELQNAQFDLGQSIGLLTKQSSDLILFNTAISKVLVDQQGVMQQQQELLQKQAVELASQNESIMGHQIRLSQQQKEISLANQGLLEAKSLTSDQALKLIGCVQRVEAAEQKMEVSNQELERSVIGRIVACEERAVSIKTEVDEVLSNYRQEAGVKLEELDAECNSAIEGLRGQFSNFDLKIHAESEVRKLAVTSVAEEFNQRIDGLQNEQAVSHKKLLSELDSAKQMASSQITALSSSFYKRESDATEKHKKLLYSSISALIFSVLSLATSVYVSLGA